MFSSFLVWAAELQLWEPKSTNGSEVGSKLSTTMYLWCIIPEKDDFTAWLGDKPA